MENNFNHEQYRKAQKIITERKNFILFSVGYVIVVLTLYFIDFDQLNFGFDNKQRNFLLFLQGLVLIIYGFYLYIPYFHNWEERKTKELMNKYNQKSQR